MQRYVPDFEKRWNQYARAVGDSWRVDETYIKIKGQWVYLYRAVDKQGRTVDFLLSQRRDVATAKRFLFPCDETAWSPEGDHAGRLRSLASSGGPTQSGWNSTAPGTDSLLPILEQRRRARSSPDQTAHPADARIQAIRDDGRDDPGH